MDVDGPAVVELEKLMLASTNHALDACAAQRPQLRRGHLPAKCGVQQGDAGDLLSKGGAPQTGGGPLYFGKLRHGASSGKAIDTQSVAGTRCHRDH
jgi:hypothetical protein